MNYETTLFFLVGVFLLSTIIVSIAPSYYVNNSPGNKLEKTRHSLINHSFEPTTPPSISSSSQEIVLTASLSKKHLAILCIERSGSTWLTAMLNKNPQVNILAEPLLPLAGKHRKSPLKDISALNELNLLTMQLDALEKDSKYRLIGFNEKFVTPKYITPSSSKTLQSLSNYFKEYQYKIIVLIRKNHLFQAVSTIRAVQLAERCGDAGWSKVNQPGWREICGKAQEEVNNLDISIITLQETVKEIRLKTREILQSAVELNLPHLLIYYEDLMQSTPETMQTISKWVEYPLEIQETLFVKQGVTDLSLAIPNYEEIKKYLEKFDSCLLEHLVNFNPQEFCLDEPSSSSS